MSTPQSTPTSVERPNNSESADAMKSSVASIISSGPAPAQGGDPSPKPQGKERPFIAPRKEEPAPQANAQPATPQQTPQQAPQEPPQKEPEGKTPNLPTDGSMNLNKMLTEMQDRIITTLRSEFAQQMPQQVQPEPPVAAQMFTAEQVKEAMYDEAKMTELLNSVIAKASEASLQSVPKVVSQTVQRQSTVQQAISKFWEDNKALEGSRDYVAFLTAQVESVYPNWSVDQVLEEVANRAYTNLNIRREAAQTVQDTHGTAPKFLPGSGGNGMTRQSSDDRSEEQKQIDRVINTGQRS